MKDFRIESLRQNGRLVGVRAVDTRTGASVCVEDEPLEFRARERAVKMLLGIVGAMKRRVADDDPISALRYDSAATVHLTVGNGSGEPVLRVRRA